MGNLDKITTYLKDNHVPLDNLTPTTVHNVLSGNESITINEWRDLRPEQIEKLDQLDNGRYNPILKRGDKVMVIRFHPAHNNYKKIGVPLGHYGWVDSMEVRRALDFTELEVITNHTDYRTEPYRGDVDRTYVLFAKVMVTDPENRFYKAEFRLDPEYFTWVKVEGDYNEDGEYYSDIELDEDLVNWSYNGDEIGVIKETLEEKNKDNIDRMKSDNIRNMTMIPTSKRLASEVIYGVLTSHGYGPYSPGDTINLEQETLNGPDGYDFENRLRFDILRESLKLDKEGRGFSFEGIIAGFFGGKPAQAGLKEDIYIDGVPISVKQSNAIMNGTADAWDTGSLLGKELDGDIVSGYNLVKREIESAGLEVPTELDDNTGETKYGGKVKRSLSTFETPYALLVAGKEYDMYKRRMLKTVFTSSKGVPLHWIFAGIKENGDIKYRYMSSEELIDNILNVANIHEVIGLGRNRENGFRIKSKPILTQESTSQIILPVITEQELIDETYEEEGEKLIDRIANLFGDKASRVNRKAINYIKDNPSEFLERLKVLMPELQKLTRDDVNEATQRVNMLIIESINHSQDMVDQREKKMTERLYWWWDNEGFTLDQNILMVMGIGPNDYYDVKRKALEYFGGLEGVSEKIYDDIDSVEEITYDGHTIKYTIDDIEFYTSSGGIGTVDIDVSLDPDGKINVMGTDGNVRTKTLGYLSWYPAAPGLTPFPEYDSEVSDDAADEIYDDIQNYIIADLEAKYFDKYGIETDAVQMELGKDDFHTDTSNWRDWGRNNLDEHSDIFGQGLLEPIEYGEYDNDEDWEKDVRGIDVDDEGEPLPTKRETSPEDMYVSPTKGIESNICNTEGFCSEQGPITFGQLKALIDTATNKRLGSDIARGGFKTIWRLVPFFLPQLLLVSAGVTITRAINKIITPALKDTRGHKSWWGKAVLKAMDIAEGDYIPDKALGDDPLSKIFFISDGLLSMLKDKYKLKFARYVSAVAESKPDNEIVPEWFVDDLLRDYLNQKFLLDPPLQTREEFKKNHITEELQSYGGLVPNNTIDVSDEQNPEVNYGDTIMFTYIHPNFKELDGIQTMEPYVVEEESVSMATHSSGGKHIEHVRFVVKKERQPDNLRYAVDKYEKNRLSYYVPDGTPTKWVNPAYIKWIKLDDETANKLMESEGHISDEKIEETMLSKIITQNKYELLKIVVNDIGWDGATRLEPTAEEFKDILRNYLKIWDIKLQGIIWLTLRWNTTQAGMEFNDSIIETLKNVDYKDLQVPPSIYKVEVFYAGEVEGDEETEWCDDEGFGEESGDECVCNHWNTWHLEDKDGTPLDEIPCIDFDDYYEKENHPYLQGVDCECEEYETKFNYVEVQSVDTANFLTLENDKVEDAPYNDEAIFFEELIGWGEEVSEKGYWELYRDERYGSDVFDGQTFDGQITNILIDNFHLSGPTGFLNENQDNKWVIMESDGSYPFNRKEIAIMKMIHNEFDLDTIRKLANISSAYGLGDKTETYSQILKIFGEHKSSTGYDNKDNKQSSRFAKWVSDNWNEEGDYGNLEYPEKAELQWYVGTLNTSGEQVEYRSGEVEVLGWDEDDAEEEISDNFYDWGGEQETYDWGDYNEYDSEVEEVRLLDEAARILEERNKPKGNEEMVVGDRVMLVNMDDPYAVTPYTNGTVTEVQPNDPATSPKMNGQDTKTSYIVAWDGFDGGTMKLLGGIDRWMKIDSDELENINSDTRPSVPPSRNPGIRYRPLNENFVIDKSAGLSPDVKEGDNIIIVRNGTGVQIPLYTELEVKKQQKVEDSNYPDFNSEMLYVTDRTTYDSGGVGSVFLALTKHGNSHLLGQKERWRRDKISWLKVNKDDTVLNEHSNTKDGYDDIDVQTIVDRVYPHIVKDLGPSKYVNKPPTVELWNDIYARLSGIPEMRGEASSTSKSEHDDYGNMIYIYYPNMKNVGDVIKALLHEYTHSLQDPTKKEENRALGYENDPNEIESRAAELNWEEYLQYVEGNLQEHEEHKDSRVNPELKVGDEIIVVHHTKNNYNFDITWPELYKPYVVVKIKHPNKYQPSNAQTYYELIPAHTEGIDYSFKKGETTVTGIDLRGTGVKRIYPTDKWILNPGFLNEHKESRLSPKLKVGDEIMVVKVGNAAPNKQTIPDTYIRYFVTKIYHGDEFHTYPYSQTYYGLNRPDVDVTDPDRPGVYNKSSTHKYLFPDTDKWIFNPEAPTMDYKDAFEPEFYMSDEEVDELYKDDWGADEENWRTLSEHEEPKKSRLNPQLMIGDEILVVSSKGIHDFGSPELYRPYVVVGIKYSHARELYNWTHGEEMGGMEKIGSGKDYEIPFYQIEPVGMTDEERTGAMLAGGGRMKPLYIFFPEDGHSGSDQWVLRPGFRRGELNEEDGYIDDMVYRDEPMDKHIRRMDKDLGSLEGFPIEEFKNVPPPTNESNKTEEEIEYLEDIPVDKNLVDSADEISKHFTNFLSSKGLEFPKQELKEVMPGVKAIILRLKYHYNRPRPWQIAQEKGLELNSETLKSSSSPSYPSGHATQGRFVARYLADLYPEYGDELTQIGEDIAFSRNMAKVHYPSDSKFGKLLGDSMYDYVYQPQEELEMQLDERNINEIEEMGYGNKRYEYEKYSKHSPVLELGDVIMVIKVDGEHAGMPEIGVEYKVSEIGGGTLGRYDLIYDLLPIDVDCEGLMKCDYISKIKRIYRGDRWVKLHKEDNKTLQESEEFQDSFKKWQDYNDYKESRLSPELEEGDTIIIVKIDKERENGETKYTTPTPELRPKTYTPYDVVEKKTSGGKAKWPWNYVLVPEGEIEITGRNQYGEENNNVKLLYPWVYQWISLPKEGNENLNEHKETQLNPELEVDDIIKVINIGNDHARMPERFTDYKVYDIRQDNANQEIYYALLPHPQIAVLDVVPETDNYVWLQHTFLYPEDKWIRSWKEEIPKYIQEHNFGHDLSDTKHSPELEVDDVIMVIKTEGGPYSFSAEIGVEYKVIEIGGSEVSDDVSGSKAKYRRYYELVPTDVSYDSITDFTDQSKIKRIYQGDDRWVKLYKEGNENLNEHNQTQRNPELKEGDVITVINIGSPITNATPERFLEYKVMSLQHLHRGHWNTTEDPNFYYEILPYNAENLYPVEDFEYMKHVLANNGNPNTKRLYPADTWIRSWKKHIPEYIEEQKSFMDNSDQAMERARKEALRRGLLNSLDMLFDVLPYEEGEIVHNDVNMGIYHKETGEFVPVDYIYDPIMENMGMEVTEADLQLFIDIITEWVNMSMVPDSVEEYVN